MFHVQPSTEQNNLRRSRFKRPINYNYIYNKTKSHFHFL